MDPASSTVSRIPEPSSIDQLLRSLVESRATPGLAIAVSMPGGEFYSFAGDRKAGRSNMLVNESTNFPLGCIIKPLLALVCLELVVQGLIDLDASVEEMLPELRSTDGFRREPITLRHILGHRSGYREPQGRHDRWVLDWPQFAASFREREQLMRPGSVWSYCQTGHAIVARLVERAAGQPAAMLVEDMILRPLDIALHEPNSVEVRENGGVPHSMSLRSRRFEPMRLPAETGFFSHSIAGASLTVKSYLRLAALFGGKAVPDTISIEAFRLFSGVVSTTPLPVSSGEPEVPPNAYGLGLARYGIAVGHNGSQLGTTCTVRCDPRANVGVAVCLNSWNPVLRDRLARKLLYDFTGNGQHLLCPFDLRSTDFEPWAGHYRGLMFGMGEADLVVDGDRAEVAVRQSSGPTNIINLSRAANGHLLAKSQTPLVPLALEREPATGEPYLLIGTSAYKRVSAVGA